MLVNCCIGLGGLLWLVSGVCDAFVYYFVTGIVIVLGVGLGFGYLIADLVWFVLGFIVVCSVWCVGVFYYWFLCGFGFCLGGS